MNDRDIGVIARDFAILMILAEAGEAAESIDCVVHLWYSALIRPSHLDLLSAKVRNPVKEVVSKLEKKSGPQYAPQKDLDFRT
jgi:hypothetical protein